jgi:ABC-type glycerol-3-phosphate transport system substrate-binding protein
VIEVREMQAAGRVAFTLDGPWMQGWFRTLGGEALDDEYVAGLMPMAADGNRYGIANNHVMAVSSQSKAKDAAVNYIKFFTQSVEMNRIFHEDFGFIPVNRSVRAEVMDPDDPFFKPFIEAAEYSVAVPSDNPNLPGAMEFVAAAMQGAILGGDPEALAEQAHNGIRTLWQQ